MANQIILMSRSIVGNVGFELLKNQLSGINLEEKKILIFAGSYFAEYSSLYYAARKLGFATENVHLYDENIHDLSEYDYLYVNEGNTFEIMRDLQKCDFYSQIKKEVYQGKLNYIGVSAGAVIAGTSIETAFYGGDRNKVYLENFDGLALIDKNVVPHVTKKEAEERPSAYISKEDYYIGNSEIIVFEADKKN